MSMSNYRRAIVRRMEKEIDIHCRAYYKINVEGVEEYKKYLSSIFNGCFDGTPETSCYLKLFHVKNFEWANNEEGYVEWEYSEEEYKNYLEKEISKLMAQVKDYVSKYDK